jgi:hypothetical protein
MAYTDLQICNRALTKIGVTTPVTVLGTMGDSNDLHEQIAGDIYPIARDMLLAEHHWTFATKREDPTEDETIDRDGWDHIYPLASDLIEIQMIWNGDRSPKVLDRTTYDIEHDASTTPDRSILLTDFLDPTIIYTFRVDEALWPNYFVNAMAAQLAADFSVSLAKKPSLIATYRQEAALALSKAMTMDLRAIQEEPEPDSLFITGR